MTGFDYIFTSTTEIIRQMNFSHLSLWSYIYLVVGILLVVSMVYYFIPHIDIWLQSKKEDKKNRKKRQLMNKIVLQKSLEDIIARELETGKT